VLCYRAGESIAKVVGPLRRELSESNVSHELVLVANTWPGDGDPTPDVVERYRDGNTKIVKREKQGAMGWDMRSGLEAATGGILVVIDGDSQNPTEDVLRMYMLMRQSGVDVMKGVRIARFDGLVRRLISVVYNFLFRALFGTTGLWDINGKPKGITRHAYELMDLRADDWFIDAEIVLEAKRNRLEIAEMPVVFRRNDDRDSFVRITSILEFIRNMLRYRMTRWR
jgi:glycosyltransferase involved in cell wall biosynthesis